MFDTNYLNCLEIKNFTAKIPFIGLILIRNALQKYLDNNIYRVGGRDTGFVLDLQIHNETFFHSNKQLESFRASEKQSSVVKVFAFFLMNSKFADLSF